MQLPEDFSKYTREIMGEDRFHLFLQGMEKDPAVSIRLNPLKSKGWSVAEKNPVPWCEEGFYLSTRPNFTFDPLLHAGVYYVQEASSMFISHVLRHLYASSAPLTALDLCAAPGGKSTAAIASLPQGSKLYSNEPIRQRAQILSENIQKWGYPDCTVTNNYPCDFQKSGLLFDLVIADAPCSGEGMFRKDPKAIEEWSTKNVEKCWRLQREIISDIWGNLKTGGILAYSTCTFNTKENEENVLWICEELGAELIEIPIKECWNITGSLLTHTSEGKSLPIYRFIPGITRGEGLFMAVLRKTGGEERKGKKKQPLNILYDGHRETAEKQVELTYTQALSYLQRQALQLPADTPRGIVEVTFQGFPLGLCKNIGNRANNLYPQEWRIKTTHIPTDYEAILRHT